MASPTPSHATLSSPPPATRPNTSTIVRYPSTTSRKTIYDRNLNRTKTAEVSRAAFAYIFIEMVNYAQRQVKGITDLEKRLNLQGYPLGLKLLDLLLSRTTPQPSVGRPTRIIALLSFIQTGLWTALFGRKADNLEVSASNAAEYMITDNDPLVNQYISVPKEMSQLNCAAFVAGIIEGVCDGAGFKTVSVSAHWAGEGGPDEKMWPGKTVFLLRFTKEVLEREEMLGKAGS
jgi:hypothetical protein